MATTTTMSSGTARPEVELGSTIDALKVGGYHIWVAFLCAAVVFLDGFDAQAIGYVAPAVSKAWGLKPGALGPVFSAGLLGIMVGALSGGPLADAIGRRKVILGSCLWFGLCSLATAYVGDMTQLMTLRFITGLGLGAAMPNAIAMVSEYSPARRRAVMVMTMFCGFSLGAALGGLAAGALLRSGFPWQTVFIIGGIAPVVFAPFLFWALPESVRFLATKDSANPAVGKILTRLGAQLPAQANFIITEEKARGISVAQLFGEKRALATVLLWVVFFMSLLDLYFLSSWLPTLINGMGFSESTAAFVTALLQVGGTTAPPILGAIIDRAGFFGVITVIYLAAAGVIASLGFVGPDVVLLSIAVYFAGFCVVGGQGSANALASCLYPTVIRGTGIGWALGIGRIGSILGPTLGGYMLAQKYQLQSIFLIITIPALIAALAGVCLWLLKPKLTNAH